jgi:hypothetical protein
MNQDELKIVLYCTHNEIRIICDRDLSVLLILTAVPLRELLRFVLPARALANNLACLAVLSYSNSYSYSLSLPTPLCSACPCCYSSDKCLLL